MEGGVIEPLTAWKKNRTPGAGPACELTLRPESLKLTDKGSLAMTFNAASTLMSKTVRPKQAA